MQKRRGKRKKQLKTEGRTATEASEASAAAHEEKILEKSQAAAPEGTAASEAHERNEKDKKTRGAEAAYQEAKTEENERKTIADASAATAAAAADEGIKQKHAAAPEGTAASEALEMNEKDERIRALIQERKTTAKHSKDQIREISKEIKKCIRDNKRLKRQEKIQKILEKVKGTKNISSIKSVKKRILIPRVKNKEGEVVKSRQGIADVFAKFYEDLYVGEGDYAGGDVMLDEEIDQNECIKAFTIDEIQNDIDRLKKGKAKDSNGIRAEQLKLCSDDTKEQIRTIFNEIAQQEDFTPKSWRKIRIQVIYKKSDRENAGNLQVNLWSTNSVQVVRYGTLCSTRPWPAQNTTSRSGGVSAQPQMRGSPDGVQSVGAAMSRVGCTIVYQHDRLHESICLTVSNILHCGSR